MKWIWNCKRIVHNSSHVKEAMLADRSERERKIVMCINKYDDDESMLSSLSLLPSHQYIKNKMNLEHLSVLLLHSFRPSHFFVSLCFAVLEFARENLTIHTTAMIMMMITNACSSCNWFRKLKKKKLLYSFDVVAATIAAVVVRHCCCFQCPQFIINNWIVGCETSLISRHSQYFFVELSSLL